MRATLEAVVMSVRRVRRRRHVARQAEFESVSWSPSPPQQPSDAVGYMVLTSLRAVLNVEAVRKYRTL